MELKSLLLGLFFSIGVFAFKSGVGLSYFLSTEKRRKTRYAVLVGHSGFYFLLFFLSLNLIRRVDLLQHFDVMQSFIKAGMSIHLLLACLMALWGAVLLKKGNGKTEDAVGTGRRFGWLTMALPCPVCGTVIFMSVAFLLSYFPENGVKGALLMYAGFMGITFATLAIVRLWQKRSGTAPETLLGAAMLAVAVYFGLSVSIMPQFGDIDKIYRLAMYQGEATPVNSEHRDLFTGVIIAAIMTGFTLKSAIIRRSKPWM